MNFMERFVDVMIPLGVVFLIWFVPVALVYKAAEAGRKNTDYVLFAGLFLGWIGAAVIALILPNMDEAQWAEFKAKSKRQRGNGGSSFGERVRVSQSTIVVIGLALMVLTCVGFITLLATI
jgi:hypothetical protein